MPNGTRNTRADPGFLRLMKIGHLAPNVAAPIAMAA